MRGMLGIGGMLVGDGWHCWLAQQWTPGTRFTLLGEPAVPPNIGSPVRLVVSKLSVQGRNFLTVVIEIINRPVNDLRLHFALFH